MKMKYIIEYRFLLYIFFPFKCNEVIHLYTAIFHDKFHHKIMKFRLLLIVNFYIPTLNLEVFDFSNSNRSQSIEIENRYFSWDWLCP